jgi:hypothetical protein
MQRARPTLRTLRDDLVLALPPADEPLDEIDHPLLTKANEQFAVESTPHERIRAVKDEILFKVKIQRWRGAAWVEADQPWLIAAGTRESGSPDDFYNALAADAEQARARYNTEHTPPLATTTHVGHLLPNESDRLRYQAEEATPAPSADCAQPSGQSPATPSATATSTDSNSAPVPSASTSAPTTATRHTPPSESPDRSPPTSWHWSSNSYPAPTPPVGVQNTACQTAH